MVDEKPGATDEKEPDAKPAPAPTPAPKKSKSRQRRAAAAESTDAEPKPKAAKEEGPRAPRRPTLDPELQRLMNVRDALSLRRPRFVRQAAHRYERIGRWGSWRSPRGLQSKQRRHYGYRSRVVSIGYGSPAETRGLTPTGFKPVLVRTPDEIAALDIAREAAVIARTVGTRRRLVLEEAARKRGVKVLNPIVTDRREE